MIINLAVNARDAMPDGGKLTIETRNVTIGPLEQRGRDSHVPPGHYAMLAVTDNGSGMDEATKARIFEPFYTTKPVGKGTGLGLATVYGIVEESSGYITVETKIGKGTCFKVYLPRADEDAELSPERTVQIPQRQGSGTILLVEDEEDLRDLLVEHLRANGYTLLVASNGAEALHIAGQHPGKIDLLITDIIMPLMNGTALVRSLRVHWPEINVLYMSGYMDDTLERVDLLESHAALIHKPFSLTDFKERVWESLADPLRVSQNC